MEDKKEEKKTGSAPILLLAGLIALAIFFSIDTSSFDFGELLGLLFYYGGIALGALFIGGIASSILSNILDEHNSFFPVYLVTALAIIVGFLALRYDRQTIKRIPERYSLETTLSAYYKNDSYETEHSLREFLIDKYSEYELLDLLGIERSDIVYDYLNDNFDVEAEIVDNYLYDRPERVEEYLDDNYSYLYYPYCCFYYHSFYLSNQPLKLNVDISKKAGCITPGLTLLRHHLLLFNHLFRLER